MGGEHTESETQVGEPETLAEQSLRVPDGNVVLTTLFALNPTFGPKQPVARVQTCAGTIEIFAALGSDGLMELQIRPHPVEGKDATIYKHHLQPNEAVVLLSPVPVELGDWIDITMF